jgi:hypothetical protein
MRKELYLIPKKLRGILVDFFIIDLAIIFTLILVSTDLEKKILSNFQGFEFVSYFLSGVFAVNFITALPALTFQSKIVTTENILAMTSFIVVGNVTGDYLIFHFFRFRVLEHITRLLKKSTKAMSILKSRNNILKVIMIVAGASVLISPLPDEVGIILMGISRIKPIYFILISLVLNLIGTYIFLSLFI